MNERYINPKNIDLKLGALESDGELLIPLSAVRAAIAAAPSEDVVKVVGQPMNKQIEEIARVFNKGMCSDRDHVNSCAECVGASEHCVLYQIATRIYNAGYRKQSEGEWIYHECVSSYDGMKSGYSCSACNSFVDENSFDSEEFHKAFCGACGAKMKGGE